MAQNSIAVIVALGLAGLGLALMVGASTWGSDNLPWDIHVICWHIVAMR